MIFVLVGAMLVIVALLWWLLIRTEGVYLGQRVVIGLYDLYARRYDGIVQHDDIEEHLHLAQPLMMRLDPQTTVRVLDVATGTGRLPLALCQHARFEGQVIALDASRGMLAQAQRKIAENHFDAYVDFVWGDGQALPYPNNHFDVVTCMEALEFMPSPADALRELVRVLRPSGLMLITRRIHEPLMPGRLWSKERMHDLLRDSGMSQITFEDWQYDYEKVWAVKEADNVPIKFR
ncbi:MAG: class I SAM-dependent methyltransferase [Anaerolineae bacterium]